MAKMKLTTDWGNSVLISKFNAIVLLVKNNLVLSEGKIYEVAILATVLFLNNDKKGDAFDME
ncbi:MULTISPECIES: hypothetical protein [Paenibacillus]|uniref:hypothetical protein n=1 Tax=Paenibacillus TaxID=44249 RepID=UPI000DA1A59C|nr:hypothetical protein [Paenibacillus illinoisensis]